MEQTRNCGNNGFDMYNIGDRCEYVQYAIEIERTLHNMQKELNTCIDPRKAAMLIMRVAQSFTMQTGAAFLMWIWRLASGRQSGGMTQNLEKWRRPSLKSLSCQRNMGAGYNA